MTKRIALLVAVLTVVAAPTLMADCWRCKIVPAPEVSYCIPHTSYQFQGWTECYEDETGCLVSGGRCWPDTAQLSSPLAAEYQVASVERLDEPQTAEAVVADDATPAAR